MTNRLASSRSPYLLQHASNPVDWYPWGDEAFAAATQGDKPIFLSIGYSTCHWCHVMAHESFEDAGIARLLNESFIAIKVDREERPDVDRVYMTFVQATTGAGGWPMSVWLTPALKPFLGGTYFPPSTRWGRPGFSEVLNEISKAWRQDRPRVLEAADMMTTRLREATGTDGRSSSAARGTIAGREAVDAGITQFEHVYDVNRGGFGGAPKFPRPSELLFLLQASSLTGEPKARLMALETLQAMAAGGIRDQIGGGFHRYSVDADWRVPHFEKMLYDQAQLVLAYLEAAQAAGDSTCAEVAADTLEYVLREMTAPDGLFFSAEDADSAVPGREPGHEDARREGAFYVWPAAEIERLFGSDAPIVRRRFGIEDAGNAPADPQGEFTGQNILYVAQSVEEIAARTGRSAADVRSVLERARLALFEARAARPRPHLDDKAITAWNGLMIAALARAARVLPEHPRAAAWRQAAERAATSIRAQLWRPADRRLLRSVREGQVSVEAFCEDYACLTWGLLELCQTTGDVAWLEWAGELTTAQSSLFFDAEDGGWFSTTGHDASVLLRLKEDYDGAEPAAASVTVRNLLTLGRLTGDSALIDRAARTLERYGSTIGKVARVMPLMMANLTLWHGRAAEVVIAGERDRDDRRALERVASTHYLPFAVWLGLDQTAAAAWARRAPWLAGMRAKNGQAAVYVCFDRACREPVTDPAALARLLEDAAAPRRLII